MNLKTSVNKAMVNPLVSARDKHAIEVKPIVPRLKNTRNAHLDYLRHFKESVETIHDIVEEAKVHIEHVTKVTTENMNLKTSVNKAMVNPLVSARDKHAIEVKPIVPRLKNTRNAHLDYLRHLKESVETIHDIVEEAKVVRPLDRSIGSACHYTKHSQE
nr:hypothetical protein [Tanacetum cinerariifolium]